tara:strand:+ start:8181 stop:8318 length:138 start_codon:yes stop_codon:yes gene_type:complete
MKDKKYTQLQRIKTLEKVVSTMWNVVKNQGEIIKEMKNDDNSETK